MDFASNSYSEPLSRRYADSTLKSLSWPDYVHHTSKYFYFLKNKSLTPKSLTLGDRLLSLTR